MTTIKVRYFIEHLPAHPTNPHDKSQRSQVHKHCKVHHWVRVDSDTIVGIGYFKNGETLKVAHAKDSLAVMPHLHDITPVKQVLDGKTSSQFTGKFDKLKAAFGLAETDTTATMLGKLLSKGNMQLEPPM